MAESARAVSGRLSAQRRNIRASRVGSELSLVDNLRFRSSRGKPQPLASTPPSQSLPFVANSSALENLAESLNIPTEVLTHLEALSDCNDGQFSTCLRLGGEGKLKHFEALGRYNEFKIMRLWRYMIGQCSLESEPSGYHSPYSSQVSLHAPGSLASTSSQARGSIASQSSSNTTWSTLSADVSRTNSPTAQLLPPSTSNSRPRFSYYCTCCSAEGPWQRKDGWVAHEERHHRLATWSCPDASCNMVFETERNFKTHHTKTNKCKKCDHATNVIKIKPLKTSFGCGFCGSHFSDLDQRMDHVGKHYDEGMTIDDWNLTSMILGLLKAPLVAQRWASLLERKGYCNGGAARPGLTWEKDLSTESTVARLENPICRLEFDAVLEDLLNLARMESQTISETKDVMIVVQPAAFEPLSLGIANGLPLEQTQETSLPRITAANCDTDHHSSLTEVQLPPSIIHYDVGPTDTDSIVSFADTTAWSRSMPLLDSSSQYSAFDFGLSPPSSAPLDSHHPALPSQSHHFLHDDLVKDHDLRVQQDLSNASTPQQYHDNNQNFSTEPRLKQHFIRSDDSFRQLQSSPESTQDVFQHLGLVGEGWQPSGGPDELATNLKRSQSNRDSLLQAEQWNKSRKKAA